VNLGLAGKVALVTAASKGLGRATALALAGEGARVMLTSRSIGHLEVARDDLVALGADVEILVGDLSDPDTPAHLVAATLERFGSVDIVIANSPGPPAGGALGLDDAAITSGINNNLLSAVRLVRAAWPLQRQAGWGRNVFITSYSAIQPVPGLALSNVARSGLWAWAKTAAQDLAAEAPGVTLNLLCPGPHATDRMKELGGGGRMGDPEDFGRIAAFLCSESARYVNGAAWVVDGGATLAL